MHERRFLNNSFCKQYLGQFLLYIYIFKTHITSSAQADWQRDSRGCWALVSIVLFGFFGFFLLGGRSDTSVVACGSAELVFLRRLWLNTWDADVLFPERLGEFHRLANSCASTWSTNRGALILELMDTSLSRVAMPVPLRCQSLSACKSFKRRRMHRFPRNLFPRWRKQECWWRRWGWGFMSAKGGSQMWSGIVKILEAWILPMDANWCYLQAPYLTEFSPSTFD